jgi:hypothetical protein
MPTDPGRVQRIEDLLTDEDRRELTRDLAEMARLRRRAEDAAAEWSLP